MWNIRPAALDDLGMIEKLLLKCELPVEDLTEHFGDSYSVAEYNGDIIGVGGIELYGSFGLLRSVAVSPSWQGKSLGESIVLNRITWAKSSGLTEIYLLTTTAELFFKRLGFRVIERNAVPTEIKKSSEFSTICPESAIVMVRSLCN